MPNPHKGDVEFKAGKKTYTLCYSIDAICVLEESTGKTLLQLGEEMRDIKSVKMSLVRSIVYAGLIEHHPSITLKEAGELIIAAGGSIKVMEKFSEAMAAAFQQKDEDAAPPSPRRRRPRAN